jgi:TrmH family RNA methyltransferase
MLFHKITSLLHPLIKHLVRLGKDRDYRYQMESVVLCGLKLIHELSSRFPFRSILLEEEFVPPFEFETEHLYRVTSQMIKKVSGLQNPEPIVAEIRMPKNQKLSSANFLLILDGISDPGNLGTLLRSACGLGWEGVFLTPGSADPYNDKAIRAAKGATFTLPWKRGSFDELAALLREKNMQLLAADTRGKDLSNFQFSPPLALALGNEAHGLTTQLKDSAEMIAVPLTGKIESLNVASVGAILMYELKA